MSFPLTETNATKQAEELNLCAISTLLSEARRVDSNIKKGMTRGAESFWKFAPDIVIRQQFAYYKGFGAYNPEMTETHHPHPLIEWHFELTDLPRFLTRLAGQNRLMSLFYEEVHPRKRESGRMMQARAFSVLDDMPVDVATVYKAAGRDPEYRFNPEIELYKLVPNNNFTYALARTEFLPPSHRAS